MGFFDSIFGTSADKIPLPQMNNYAPGNLPGADANAFGGIANLGGYNLYPGQMQNAMGVTGNLLNNPGAPSWLQGAQYAQGMGQAGANNAFGAGGGLMSLGGNIAGTAFDPQHDLYNRTLQQVQDQTRSGQAARGISMTPYGAGLEDQSTRNFNIDWQNQQLQRQIAGGQAAGGLIGQGAGMQLNAPGQYYQFSGLPYQTGQQIGQNQFGAINQLGQFGQQGAQIPQQQIADYMNYLGWGTGAQNAANSAQLGGFNAQLNREKLASDQQSNMWSGLGKIGGGLWGTGLQGGGTVGSSVLGMFGLSDARAKDDIVPVGSLNDGQPVYSFRYKGDPTPRIGLMAQDVEKVRPDAVIEVGGVKMVDYGKATEFSRGLAALSNWG